MENFKLQDLCIKNILCKDDVCQKKHPRCFAGLCIQGIMYDNKSGQCNDNLCELHHISKNQFYSIEILLPSINGVYRFNLCNKQNCREPSRCPFLHRKWAEGKCTQYFFFCQEDHTNHISWKNLQTQVYREYEVKLKSKNNPENNLEDYENYFQEQNVCMKNFNGLCDKRPGECFKQHFDWEETDKINIFHRNILKSCKEENDLKKYEVEQFQHKSILYDEDQLQKLKQAIKEQNIVDIIFIMDFTGSMQNWMDQCKSNIQGIMDYFQLKIPQCTLRMGLVGYRDFCDDQRLVFHDLTNNAKSIVQFLSKQVASGGGDIAEDLFSGLQKAMELNISKHPKSLLITILFTDAPCHGSYYHHKDITDFYAEVIQAGTLEKLMQKYYQMKENNFFTCLNISKITEQMFQIMQQNFPNLIISEPSKHQDFEKIVRNTVSQNISSTISLKKTQFFAKYQKPKYIDLNLDDSNSQDYPQFLIKLKQWIKFRFQDTILESYEYRQDQFENQEGTNFVVRKYYDVTLNQYIVLKINKKVYGLNNLTDTMSGQYSKEAEDKFYISSLAWSLAQQFRTKIQGIEGAPPIFFPLPILYTFKDQRAFGGQQKIYGEVFIDIKDKWSKYSNNQAFIDQDKYYYSVFTHFVLEQSKRQFTFTDLQGIRNLFSDVAIQTIKNIKTDDSISFKNSTNFENDGIGSFLFSQHQKCSILCQKLGLPNLSKENIYDQKLWKSEREDGKIDIFCEGCDSQFAITPIEYKYKLYQKCEQCKAREQYSYDQVCQCCRKSFNIKLNTALNNGTNQKFCDECKQKCLEQPQNKDQCYYCKIKCKWNIKKYQIPKNSSYQVTICNVGIKYLKGLNCFKCAKPYDFSNVVENEDYDKKYFICESCKNNSNFQQ